MGLRQYKVCLEVFTTSSHLLIEPVFLSFQPSSRYPLTPGTFSQTHTFPFLSLVKFFFLITESLYISLYFISLWSSSTITPMHWCPYQHPQTSQTRNPHPVVHVCTHKPRIWVSWHINVTLHLFILRTQNINKVMSHTGPEISPNQRIVHDPSAVLSYYWFLPISD